MSVYLSEQTPHLRNLHSQLSLPAEALDADLARIEAAIRGVITSIIREREAQVDSLKDEISQVKRDIASLARAVGEKGRDVVAVSRRESFDAETLPRQLERLSEQVEELRKVYDERLQHIQTQQATLDTLSALLGPPFQPPEPLQPVASSSKQPNEPELKTRKSTQTLAQAINEGKVPAAWYDVGESVTEELDAAVQKALEERDTRRQNLCVTFFNLIWLHNELALPPVPTSTPHHFPSELLPPHEEEETPGAYATYERILSRIISSNPLPNEPEGEQEEQQEQEREMIGMEVVEPEIGMIDWAEEIQELWNGKKEIHEAKIQEMYNLIEPLWSRLEVEQEVTDLFVEMNRGSGDATIAAYEAEYERLLEIRRSSLSSFIVNTRKEIDALQTELMMSDDERAEFGAYIDDDYSEELLHAHEEEVERLREEVESKSLLLPKVREWHTLVLDEEELERNANDPNRFNRRGAAMLREEKLRKRVNILKPKLENDLLTLLPTWEEEHGRPFMVSGERVVSKIENALEAKELTKEAKKRAKMGLGPAPARTAATGAASLPKHHTPAQTKSRAVVGTGTGTAGTRGKREAPTPTPLGAYRTNKRQRLIPSSTTTTTSAASSSVRFGGGLGTKGSMMNGTGTGRSVSASITRNGTTMTSPTPYNHSSGRALSHGGGALGNITHTIQSRIPSYSNSTTTTGIGKADCRKPIENAKAISRRQSFKPRPSIAPIGGLGGGAGIRVGGDWGLREEDEDVF